MSGLLNIQNVTRFMSTTEAATQPKKMPKKRPRAANSEQEDDSASDYTHPACKRARSAKVTPAKSAATTTRKRKPVQFAQPDDSDDSSAIVIVAKKAVKANAGI
jgi:hypothetical protein